MTALSEPAASGLFEIEPDWLRLRRCRVCGGALAAPAGDTYVMRRQWWVKIGRSNAPRRRLNELRREDWKQYIVWPPLMDWSEPLQLLAVIAGDVEHELHERFAGCHDVGEWFIPDEAMREWLADIA